jgi:hypothetical protein
MRALVSCGDPVRLAETRNVDDQVEWIDDGHVAYGIPESDTSGATDVWSVRADGGGMPQLLVKAAWSPSVVFGTAG